MRSNRATTRTQNCYCTIFPFLEHCVFFFLKKVKFWGLIFQSGPRNRQSTFWKTTPVKFEKIQLLPLCYRSLRPNWTASGDRTNSFYFIHWKGPGKVFIFLQILSLLFKFKINLFTYDLRCFDWLLTFSSANNVSWFDQQMLQCYQIFFMYYSMQTICKNCLINYFLLLAYIYEILYLFTKNNFSS